MLRVFKQHWPGIMRTRVTVSLMFVSHDVYMPLIVLYTYIVEQERQFHSNHKPLGELQTDISVNDRTTLMTWLIRICISNHFQSMHLVCLCFINWPFDLCASGGSSSLRRHHWRLLVARCRREGQVPADRRYCPVACIKATHLWSARHFISLQAVRIHLLYRWHQNVRGTNAQNSRLDTTPTDGSYLCWLLRRTTSLSKTISTWKTHHKTLG